MTTPMTESVTAVDGLLRSASLTEYLTNAGVPIDRANATYTRFKPGAGAVVALELEHDGVTSIAYLRRSDHRDRAQEILAKAATMRPRSTELGPSVRRLDPHTVLFLFPTDAKLRRLRWMGSGNKIRHVVADVFDDGPYCGNRSKITILRYKPERRLVGKATLVPKTGCPERTFVYRYTRTNDAGRLAATNRAVLNAGIQTAAPIATLEGGQLHLEQALPAIPMVDAIGRRHIDPASIAEILVRIGSVSPNGMPITSTAEDLEAALGALESTATYQPQLAREIAALGRLMIRACPPSDQLVSSHGDLHLHQFMVDATTTYLVDWERASLGHPARDVARLLAHSHALRIRRPELPVLALSSLVADAVDSFRRRVNLAEEHLGYYLAAAFIDQALLVSRHLEPDNERRAESFLALAATAVECGAEAVDSTPFVSTPGDRRER